MSDTLVTLKPSTCVIMVDHIDQIDDIDRPDELGFVRWRATFKKSDYTDLESLRLVGNSFERLRLNKSRDLVGAARAIADEGRDGEKNSAL